MRIFEHWACHRGHLVIGRERIPASAWGGSAVSPEEAAKDAERRFAAAQARVDGRDQPEDYQADIREEILARFSDRNAITRNRYGAEVLNTATLPILDIDHPPSPFRFAGLFRPKPPKIERVLDLVKKGTADYPGAAFRVYETHSGARVIVAGLDLDPASDACARFMARFGADPLYAILCRKQGCFRARLTPKASRMKMRGHKVVWPRDAAQETAFAAWLPGYQEASARYAVCRFADIVGRGPGPCALTRIHDEKTGAFSGKPLA